MRSGAQLRPDVSSLSEKENRNMTFSRAAVIFPRRIRLTKRGVNGAYSAGCVLRFIIFMFGVYGNPHD